MYGCPLNIRGWSGPSSQFSIGRHYNGVTDFPSQPPYNSGMPGNELNRDTHTFTHKGYEYSIYTFMTRDGILSYRVWRKMDEGQAETGEARADLIQRIKNQLENL